MGSGFKLQIALSRVDAVVVPQGALDIDGVRVVALDQVAVVAVHRPHEVREGDGHAVQQAATEAGRAAGKLDREIGQRRAMPRRLADHHRLHQADGFAAIRRWPGRINVRLYVLFVVLHK